MKIIDNLHNNHVPNMYIFQRKMFFSFCLNFPKESFSYCSYFQRVCAVFVNALSLYPFNNIFVTFSMSSVDDCICLAVILNTWVLHRVGISM